MIAALTFLHLTAALTLSCASSATFARGDVAELETNYQISGRDEHFRFGIATGNGGMELYCIQGTFGDPPDVVAQKISLDHPTFTHKAGPAVYPVGEGSEVSPWNKFGFYRTRIRWAHQGNVDVVYSFTFPICPTGIWQLAIAM